MDNNSNIERDYDKKETIYYTAKRIADSIEPKAKDVLYVTEEIMKEMKF